MASPRRLLVSTVGICLLGCGSPAPAPTTTESSIVEGAPDVDRFPATGLLLLDGRAVCSATLLAPDVLVTAGHCVEGGPRAFYTGPGATMPPGSDPVDFGMQRYRITDYVRYVNADGDGLPDIGMVRLDGPAGMAPAAISWTAPVADSECQLVGYGRRTDGLTGERRMASARVVDFTQTAIVVEGIDGIADSGDSGGGLYCSGSLVGSTWAKRDGATWPTNRRAAYARFDAVADWMQERIATWRAAPYAPPVPLP